MASSGPLLLFSLLPLFLLPILLQIRTSDAAALGIPLIHRDSPQSPYHNPSLSHAKRLKVAIHRTVARARRLHELSASNSNGAPLTSLVIPNTFDHLTFLSIGTPPVTLPVVVDTGSDLLWMQCKPCPHCYRQDPPLFDPKSSSTYRNVACGSAACTALNSGLCSPDDVCLYDYVYGDESYTKGIFSYETVTFNTTSGGTVSFPNIWLGCTHNSSSMGWDSQESGLVGLGSGDLSLISQLKGEIGGKFSYCLVPTDEPHATSTLYLGETATDADTATTPLIPKTPRMSVYFLALQGISVGKTYVTVQQGREGNIFVDTGSVLSVLPDVGFRGLVGALVATLKLRRVKDPGGYFELCYSYDMAKGAAGQVPDIVLHFPGASMALPERGTFTQVDEGVACLAMENSAKVVGTGILGNMAQQNFHIGFDLKNMKMSFAPRDCAKP